MTHVQGFDSMDEMFEVMGRAENDANARLTAVQVALRDTTDQTVYWARAIPEWDLVIYGIVPPNAETQKGADFDVNENRARGYLTGVAYSATPGAEDGEPGDTHVSEVIAITEETFQLARSLGWPDYSQMRLEENRALGQRLSLHERATLAR
jgi:hypothetical protein